MIYANGDIYEGSWQNDLKHGYGIIEKKNNDKYYGCWNSDLKEGQGYYYYGSTGKIYLGEWHEDVPRCGIFTDVDDENLKKVYKKHYTEKDPPANIPVLKLLNPNEVLEQSIDNVHFLRSIKEVKNKNFNELFDTSYQKELINIFQQKKTENILSNEEDKEEEQKKLKEMVITINTFKNIIREKLEKEVESKNKN